MNDKRLCCFPIEVKVRGLDPRLYLALNFVQHGYPALIGSKNAVNKVMFEMKKDLLYFSKGLAVSEADFHDEIHHRGGLIVSLKEEAGIFPKGYWDFFMDLSYDKTTVRQTDFLFLWGQRQKETVMRSLKEIPADHVFVSGHPRFDLRKPMFGDFYKALARETIAAPEKYILLNTNFGVFNNHFGLKSLIKRVEGLFKWVTPQDREKRIRHIQERYEYEKQLMPHFVELVKAISREFPDITVVVRRHPVEEEQTWKDAFADFKNVLVTQEGAAHTWIVNALCVIHHDCTTAIETVMYGRRAFSFCPVYDDRMIHEIPLKISEVIKDQQQMLRRIHELLDKKDFFLGKEAYEQNLKFIKPEIANVDFDSTDLIVNEIERCLKEGRFPKYEQSRIGRIAFAVKGLVKEIRQRIRLRSRVRFKEKTAGSRSSSKFVGLTKQEVETHVELFRKAKPSIPQVHVEQVGPAIFLLTR